MGTYLCREVSELGVDGGSCYSPRAESPVHLGAAWGGGLILVTSSGWRRWGLQGSVGRGFLGLTARLLSALGDGLPGHCNVAVFENTSAELTLCAGFAVGLRQMVTQASVSPLP